MWTDRLILGTSKLGVDGREAAYALLDEYVRLGGRVIDTAAVYSDWIPGETGRAETVLGEWLKQRGNAADVCIATKGAHPELAHVERPRCDAASIRHDVEQSLRRLGIERIDLWSLHRDDPGRPAAEIVGVLRGLVAEGKIARFGCSNWSLARIDEALRESGENFVSNQVIGNVFCRLMTPPADLGSVVLDAPTFRHAVDNGLSLHLATAAAHGYFERRAKGIAPIAAYDNPACAEAAVKLEAIAAERGIDPAPMIVAAMLQLAYPIRAIIGPRDAGQLRRMWKGGETVLPPGIVRRIAATTGMSAFFG